MQSRKEVAADTRDILTPADIAPIIGSDPQWIRHAAKTAPEKLGFPVTIIGSRVKIPCLSFLAFMTGGKQHENAAVLNRENA